MNRAGTPALPEDLIDVPALIAAYYELVPDVTLAEQKVVFGTSGHRGSSLDTAFNETHIAAITQAICEYRAAQGIDGPLFIGRDTHALSRPAETTALEVLEANGVRALVDEFDDFVPTPALSHAIIAYNRALELGGEAVSGLPRDASADDRPGRRSYKGYADGIVITPSHNPPRDGGFKYNPPHGGPADSDATGWIANRANEIILNNEDIPKAEPTAVETYDYRGKYVADLESIIDFDAIRQAKLHIAADPLGGASVHYWQLIASHYDLDLTVVNPLVDPAWGFMTLDWDGKIRMDPSSPSAMASVLTHQNDYDIVTGNDADADRHGIVTPDGGLMNPNHFLAVAIGYLFGGARPGWPGEARIGKTLVSSSMIDRVAESLGRRLWEVPVGFKWFVPGLIDGSVAFGGEESAGASFLKKDGTAWTTDKDGIILALLASEIRAVTGKSPSELYAELVAQFGDPAYERVDAVATKAQKAQLAKLDGAAITADELAGDPILARLSEAPGNGAAVGGVKVVTARAWFAARPSGTEDVYKIYAESFAGPEHLKLVQAEAKVIVDAALQG